MTTKFRKLTDEEISCLQRQMCTASDWEQIDVAEEFSTENVRYARFTGHVRLGTFRKVFELPGGIRKHSGIYMATLHNVTVGDDCCIENVKNYIANYEIGEGTFIENVDIILTDGESSFGNGVQVSVLDETGSCKVAIYDRLSAQTAYLMAFRRDRPELISRLKLMIEAYAGSVRSAIGVIGRNAVIVDAGYIKNVRIGDCCKIEGASRLKNGTIVSDDEAPVHIGVGVIGDDFIIASGSNVEDGVMFSRCFIGQACRLGHGYAATDSLFFSNCQGENGEASAVFAGPFTVTHHKSTLLIAGMFSFMNAGSGSNQSNHMYKLGPIHHGVMERGSKTASDSYILWPSCIGPFSLVMGRHVCHQDTSDLPYSYLIEQNNTTYIMPGANLKSIGTIRDAIKWPRRDHRKGKDKLDNINFNLLSPFTISKALNGIAILEDLQRVSGYGSDVFSYQSACIRRSSLLKGLEYYMMSVDKFFGNSLITKIMESESTTLEGLLADLAPKSQYGEGAWVDVAGMIAPEDVLEALYTDIEKGDVADLSELAERFTYIHFHYYDYEWRWAYANMEKYYGISLKTASLEDLKSLVLRWKDSVLKLDGLICDDARKDLSLAGRTNPESDPFIQSVKEHIKVKSDLANLTLSRLSSLIA